MQKGLEIIEKLISEEFMKKHNKVLVKLKKSWSQDKQDLYNSLVNQIINLTSFLPIDSNFTLRRRTLEFNMTSDSIVCEVPNCNCLKKFHSTSYGFSDICASNDSNHSTFVLSQKNQKTKTTSNIKYGTDSPNSSTLVKDTKSKNSLLKHGIENPTQAHYNLENYNKLTKKLIEEKFIDKIGCVKVKEFKKFINCTRLATFKLCNKFGVEYIKLSTMERHINLKNLAKLSKKFIEKKFLTKEGYLKRKKMAKFLNCTEMSTYEYCKKFGVEYNRRPPRGNRAEEELTQTITALLPTITLIRNNRTILEGTELDIYLPDQKLAVEYNGLNFHSHGITTYDFKPFNNPLSIPDRHLDKTKACSALDIDLIHIFEDEYLNNQDQINQLLRRKLNAEDWPEFTEDEIHWPINWGELPEQLQKDYKVVKSIPPRANYFRFNYPKQVSKWTSHGTEEELYEAGYRKYYDCGELILQKTD